LVAAGVFGLVDSLRRNGGDEGAAFVWYAPTRIRGALFDQLRAQDWLPRRVRRAVSSADRIDPRWGERPGALIRFCDDCELDEALAATAVSTDPEKQLEESSRARALAVAIEKLPERERHIVGMHYFHGVKFKEIG